MVRRLRQYLSPLITGLVVLASACPRAEAPAASLDAGAALPAAFNFTAETGDLLFSVLNEQGEPITADRIDAVPQPLRRRVMVVDLSRSPEQRQADRYVYFADLTRADPQQRFLATPMSRYKRSRAAATGTAGATAVAGGVVIYTAPWCGFCKKAKAYLRQKGISYVERDVEASAAAAREMEAKLRTAGAAGGGVPVIDIGGTLVMGFDRPRIDELLAKR